MFATRNVNRRQLMAAASGLALAGGFQSTPVSAQATAARELIERMTFRERVAQLFLPRFSLDPSAKTEGRLLHRHWQQQFSFLH